MLILCLGTVGSNCGIHLRISMVRTEATRRICPRSLVRPATRAQQNWSVEFKRIEFSILTFRSDTIQLVVNHFPQDESNSHNPVLLPLYHQFLSTLFDVCSPFTKDPNELAYIAAARWPGFIAPILDEYQRLLDEARGNTGDEEEECELTAPTEDARIRLIRLFTPSFTTALEALYPRLSNAAEWAADNQPQRNLLSSGFSGANLVDKSVPQTSQGTLTDVLPRMSKFILLASFLASTNPTKSDIRMFGRALNERKKRKRGAVASARGGAVKVDRNLSLWSGELIPDRSHNGTSDLSSFPWTGYSLFLGSC